MDFKVFYKGQRNITLGQDVFIVMAQLSRFSSFNMEAHTVLKKKVQNLSLIGWPKYGQLVSIWRCLVFLVLVLMKDFNTHGKFNARMSILCKA